MTTTGPDGRVEASSPSQLPLPRSPVYPYAASTANVLSSFTLPLPPPPRPAHAVLTKADIDQSQQAYSDLLATAKTYRVALAQLSNAASAFGSALEACARLKEARADAIVTIGGNCGGGGGGGYSTHGGAAGGTPSMTNSYMAPQGSCTADLLLSASGVQQLVANHQQILSETVYRSFEVPLLHEMDKWRRAMDDEGESYKTEITRRSREIRKLEKDGLKLHHRQKRRDVSKFREHLVELTGKLDGLTSVHADHARTLLRESQETSLRILEASCSLVRAEVDIFEGLARKGWTGGGLDELLEKGQDLFASDDTHLSGLTTAVPTASTTIAAHHTEGGDGAQLFSILPPMSILASGDTASVMSDSGALRGRIGGQRHGRPDSLVVENDQYQSLAGAFSNVDDDEDAESIFSDFNNSNNKRQQTRGLRPFSPQPIRRCPTDVVMDPDELLREDRDEQQQQTEEEREEPVVVDARDVSAHGLSRESNKEPHADHNSRNDQINNDEQDHSPWKDEGLRGESEF